MSIIHASRLDVSAQKAVIEGILPDVGVVVAYGPSFHGKSFVILEMLLSIANGKSFFGHISEEGGALFCLGEGFYDAGIRKQARLAAAEIPGTLTDDLLFYRMEPFALTYPADLRPVVTEMKTLSEGLIQREKPELRVIALDALGDFTGGLSLAHEASANRAMQGAKFIARELNCCVILVHHTGWDETHMGGSKRIFSAADTVIRIADGSISCEKQKGMPLFQPMGFALAEVKWEDPDNPGEYVETAVLGRVQTFEEFETAFNEEQERKPLPVLIRGDALNDGRRPPRNGLKAV